MYKRQLQLRRTEPALSTGSIELVDAGRDVLAYYRSHGDMRLFIALNFGSEPRTIGVPAGEPILSTIDLGTFEGILRANEGVILHVGN